MMEHLTDYAIEALDRPGSKEIVVFVAGMAILIYLTNDKEKK